MNKFLVAVAFFACVATAIAVPDWFSFEIYDEANQLKLWENSKDDYACGTNLYKEYFKHFSTQCDDYINQRISLRHLSNVAIHFLVETALEISSLIGDPKNGLEFEKAVKDRASTEPGKDKLVGIFRNLQDKLAYTHQQKAAGEFCKDVTSYWIPKLESKLETYKTNYNPPRVAGKFAEVEFRGVNCGTPSRISKVATTCEMIKQLAPEVLEPSAKN